MNKHISLIILLLVCINIVFAYKYYNLKTESKQDFNLYRENNKTMRNSLNNIFSTKIKYDNLKLDSIQILINNTTINWNEFQNKISLIIPEKSCNICYDEIYDAMTYIDTTYNVKINTITSINKYKELKNTFSELGIKSKLLYYKNDYFSNIKIHNAPYFLYIDQSMYSKQIFIPFTTHTGLTKLYLDKMINRYYLNKTE